MVGRREYKTLCDIPERMINIKINRSFLLFLVLFLQACSLDSGYSSPEEAFKNTNITSKGILRKIEVNNGAILFYEGENQDIGVGLVRKQNKKWEWISGHGMVSSSTDQDVTFAWSNLDRMKAAGEGYHIFWGSINNNEIIKINIKYKNGWEMNENAQLFETTWGYKLWYVINMKYPGINPGVLITGFNKEGKEIYNNS